VSEITECDERGRVTRRRWGVVAEWTGLDGDIEDTDLIRTFATERAAARKCAELSSALEGAA
jgi:hypothetical protein